MKVLLGIKSNGSAERILRAQTLGEVDLALNKDEFFVRLNDSYDAVLAHCNLFSDTYPWEWISLIRTKNPQAQVMIALDETVYDSLLLEIIIRIADEFGYGIIPVQSTEEQIALAFTEQTMKSGRQPDRANGKIVTIWSASPQDGATTLAINTTLALASTTELKVGLLDLNLKSPSVLYHLDLKSKDKNLFRLRPKLLTNTLDRQGLLDTCTTYRRLPNLHILTGNPRRETASDYSPDMIQSLLQVARNTFDITVIDVHSFPDNAATISAVREADHKWLVVQNHYESFKTSWNDWYNCYWKFCGILPEQISLIVNRTVSNDHPEDISEYLGIPLLAGIPNVSGGVGRKSVNEGIPLYFQSKVEDFVVKMNDLASLLTDGKMSTPSKRTGNLISRLTAMLS